MDELFDFREVDDLVEYPVDLPLGHAQDGTVQIHVLAPGQLRMKASPDFQQTADATPDFRSPRRRLDHLREDLPARVLGAYNTLALFEALRERFRHDC